MYVALLRGINVGGKNAVEMPRLKATFERLGLSAVRTYINSGNVIYDVPGRRRPPSASRLEKAVAEEFGFDIPILVRDGQALDALVSEIPEQWVNDSSMRCDVMFLWPAVDEPGVVDHVERNEKVEDLVYVPGALVWRIDRANVGRSRVGKVVGTALYRQLTIRNVNTVRKLHGLMQRDVTAARRSPS